MNSRLPDEDLFQFFLHQYLVNRRFLNTARIFREEAQISGEIPQGYGEEARAFLYDFCVSSYNSISRNIAFEGRNIGQSPHNDQPVDIYPIYEYPRQLQFCSRYQTGYELLCCDISSDGKIVVASGRNVLAPLIYYVETESYTALQPGSSAISAVRFFPGSNMFATSYADQVITVWDAKHPPCMLYNVTHTEIIKSIDFHPSDRILCSCNDNGIQLFDAATLNLNSSYDDQGGNIIRFQPGSGSLLAIVKGNVIQILDYPNFNVVNVLEGHIKDVKSIDWDLSGQMLASVTEDEVRVWLMGTSDSCHQYPSNGRKFQSVIFHPRHPRVVVIGCFECLESLMLDDMTSCSTRASDQAITALAASTSGTKLMVSTSDDGSMTIWK